MGIFFSRSRKEGDRQQARGASLRNSHIFPAASVVTGGPAQDARPPTFSYLPALTPLCRERRGSSLRRPCSRDHGAAWRARSGGGYPSRVLWGHHPGRRADCRLSVSLAAGPNSFLLLLLKIEKKRGIGMGRGDVYCLGRSRSSSSGRVRTGSAWVVPSSNPRRWFVLVADRWGPVLKAHRIAREDRSHRRFLWASRFSFLLRHLRQVQVQPPAM